MRRYSALLIATLALAGCTQAPPPAADADLAAEIQRIRAIDNHAHPVRITQPGEAADRFFDALPVDNMEPQSDPVNLPQRPIDSRRLARVVWSRPRGPAAQAGRDAAEGQRVSRMGARPDGRGNDARQPRVDGPNHSAAALPLGPVRRCADFSTGY